MIFIRALVTDSIVWRNTFQDDGVDDAERPFYEEDENDDRGPKKPSYVMDHDLSLLLKSSKPLLQSRNAAVSCSLPHVMQLWCLFATAACPPHTGRHGRLSTLLSLRSEGRGVHCCESTRPIITWQTRGAGHCSAKHRFHDIKEQGKICDESCWFDGWPDDLLIWWLTWWWSLCSDSNPPPSALMFAKYSQSFQLFIGRPSKNNPTHLTQKTAKNWNRFTSSSFT